MLHRPPRPSCALRAGLLLLPVALLAGCVHEKTTGPETTYSYDLWVPLLLFLGGLAAAPLGWALRPRSGRLGWPLIAVGLVAALAIAPSLYLDYVTVGTDHFVVREGIVGASTTYDVKYDDIRSLRITSETTRGRRGKKQTKNYLLCEMKVGGPVKVSLDGKIIEMAFVPLMTQLAAHKVPMANETAGDEG